jgi:hypothetical protein
MAVFEQAAQYLRECGWIKGELGGEYGGPACLVGACEAVSDYYLFTEHYQFTEQRVVPILNKIVEEQYPDRLFDDEEDLVPAARFNDHPDTTLDDVVAVLEKAEVRYNERV